MDFKNKFAQFIPNYHRQFFYCVIVLVMLLSDTTAILCLNVSVQTELASKVKAAYIINFTRFISWKTQGTAEAKSQIIIATFGTDDIGDILEDFSKKQSDNQSIVVKRLKKKISEVTGCNLLFISQTEQPQLPQILNQLEGTNVLTVSDIPGFASRGGMIGFFIEQNKVKIEINVKATTKAGLKVSAKLLEVAKLVNGDE